MYVKAVQASHNRVHPLAVRHDAGPYLPHEVYGTLWYLLPQALSDVVGTAHPRGLSAHWLHSQDTGSIVLRSVRKSEFSAEQAAQL